jgi:hypothetical protein
VRHNIFAMELCLRLEDGDPLRDDLKELVKYHPAESAAGKKWKMLQRASELLRARLHLAEKGCWDYFDDDDRAKRDYDMWCNGMITEEGARKQPSGTAGEGEGRYMTFTISLLLKADTPTARDLSRVCQIPEADLWKRSTFERILRGLNVVSFAAVKSDVFYLIPGDARWGLTAEDLTAEKFEYLRDIQG